HDMPRGNDRFATLGAQAEPEAALQLQGLGAGEPVMDLDRDAARRDGPPKQPIEVWSMDVPSTAARIGEKVIVSEMRAAPGGATAQAGLVAVVPKQIPQAQRLQQRGHIRRQGLANPVVADR